MYMLHIYPIHPHTLTTQNIFMYMNTSTPYNPIYTLNTQIYVLHICYIHIYPIQQNTLTIPNPIR